MFQSPGPVAFEVGSFPIHWYGIVIAIGIVLAYLYVFRELKRRGLEAKPFDDMAFWVIASGVIGARLYYVLFNLPYYTQNLAQIPQIWKGGLAIHGALIGGAAAFFIFVFKRKLSWKLYADIIIPGVLLAQGIGRFGNFFNNEAFGRPTSLPWKLFIPEANRPQEYRDFLYFHPTFLYESLWNIIGFVLLLLISRKARTGAHHGVVFFCYLAWYSFGRFFIEGLRTDSLYLGPLRTAQTVSVLLFIAGIIGLIFILRRHRIKDR